MSEMLTKFYNIVKHKGQRVEQIAMPDCENVQMLTCLESFSTSTFHLHNAWLLSAVVLELNLKMDTEIGSSNLCS